MGVDFDDNHSAVNSEETFAADAYQATEEPPLPDGLTYADVEEFDALSAMAPGPCNGQTFGPAAVYSACFRRNTVAVKQTRLDELRCEKEGGETKLARVLQWYHLVAYGLASTIGAGIFVVAGQVANQNAGPALAISFLIAAFSSLLSAFCYSEYAVRVPLSGSAYTFSYVTLGELIGWFIGWNLTLEYAISASAIARSWADNLAALWLQLFNSEMPEWMYTWDVFGWGTSFSPLSSVIICLCVIVLIVGVQEAAWFNLFMVVFNVALILFIIIFGCFFIDYHNWTPFAPYGVAGVFEGAGIVFFSYIGFDAVTTLAGEVENTKRDLPIGIVGSLGFVTLLYVCTSFVLTGMVPYYDVDPTAGLSQAFAYNDCNWASILVGFGAVTTLTATTFASLLGQPRIFYQMAEDGLFFAFFAKLSKKGVPVIGTLVSGGFSLVFAFLLTMDELAGVVVMRHQDPSRPKDVPIIMGIYFILCSLSAISVIYGFPYWSWPIYGLPCVIIMLSFYLFPVVDIPDGFATPLVPIVPCVGIYINLFLVFSLDPLALLRVLLWTFLGMAIYFAYGIRYSRQGKYDRAMLQKTINYSEL